MKKQGTANPHQRIDVMKVRISTLAIEQFRSLRQLKLEGLGRVNLITGRNNTAKN